MKLLLVGDVHWCETSSILRAKGKKYSLRLENLVKTVKWIEEVRRITKADKVIQLGDFFDRATLTGNELVAFNEVKNITRDWVSILGNHEMDNNGNTAVALGSEMYSQPTSFPLDGLKFGELVKDENIKVVMLPYIHEKDRKPLKEYLPEGKVIVFSHNDVSGIRYGAFESKVGFPIEEIQAIDGLFFNGHLHNKGQIGKLYNVGNITGQNFNEDAMKYGHGVVLYDTGSGEIEHIENPHALKFWQWEVKDENTFSELVMATEPEIGQLGETDDVYHKNDNWVVSVTTTEEFADRVQEVINTQCLAGRRIIKASTAKMAEVAKEGTESAVKTMNHREKFCLAVKEKFGTNDIIGGILNEVQ